MGDDAAGRGETALAVEMYRRAGGAAPGRAEVQKKLGFALIAARDLKGAAAAFEKAEAASPGDPDTLRGLGTTALLRDDADAAAGYFRRAIAASRQFDHRLYSGLGVALDLKGDHKAAQAAYRDGLQRDPRNLTLANNFALSLALEGDYARATRILRQVVEADGANERHRQNLALVLALSGDMAGARRVAGRNLDKQELDARVAYYRWLREHRKSLGGSLKPAPAAARGTRPAPAE